MRNQAFVAFALFVAILSAPPLACSGSTEPLGLAPACSSLAGCCIGMSNAANEIACNAAVEGNDSETCTELLVGYETHGSCVSTSSSSTGTGVGTSSASIATSGSGSQRGTRTESGSESGSSTGHTGTTKSHDAGVDGSFPPSEAGPNETGVDAAGGPVAPVGSTAIVRGTIVDVVGLTTDDYLIYFNAGGGLSATDLDGNIEVIASGTDADNGPLVAGIGGELVAILTDYTTTLVGGVSEPLVGTLSIWSHSLRALRQVATNSVDVLAIAADSSYLVYTDGADSTGTRGNIGIVSGTALGATDLLTNVAISTTSTTCSPFAVFDKGFVVTSSCALLDAGAETPTIRSFNGATNWSTTVLATNGGPSDPFGSGVANIATDTVAANVITVSGSPATLSVQGVTSTAPRSLFSSFAAPASGSEFFYLSHASTFAFFTEPSDALGIATFATPSSAPSIRQLSTGPVLGVQVVSPDEAWEVDYGTAIDSSTGAPTSLNLRSLTTGVATALIPSGSSVATTFGGANGFTADSQYALFSADLRLVGSNGTTGTLTTASVGGEVHQLVTNTTVWNASPLSGSSLIYNQNYVVNSATPTLPNGAATADIYTVSAAGPGPGTLIVAGADAPDAFYVTHDRSHLFFTFSQVNTSGGTATAYAADGLYSVALP